MKTKLIILLILTAMIHTNTVSEDESLSSGPRIKTVILRILSSDTTTWTNTSTTKVKGFWEPLSDDMVTESGKENSL